MSMTARLGSNKKKTVRQKFAELNWFMVMIIVAVAAFGFAMLYSVAGGSIDPWAKNQFIRFLLGLGLMIGVAIIDIRIWMFLAYPLYALALGMLVVVDVMGEVGMGAQRWLDLGFMNLQPSELMKIALVMALARYFHCLTDDETVQLRSLIKPIILIALPVVLVLRQPDRKSVV